jgi:bifunctional ADP-heptose synthase (sugar kinase/adenylyltransferase)
MVRITVVGDAMVDHYITLMTMRKSPEGNHPVVRRVNEDRLPGGAAAVAAMCRTLGAHVNLVGRTRTRPVPVKRRYVLDGTIVFREDFESIPRDDDPERDRLVIRDLMTASRRQHDLTLVADYGKGVVSPNVFKAILSAFGHKPIIVDPARCRTAEFYRGAWAVTPNRDENIRGGYWMAFERVVLKLDGDGMMVKDIDNSVRTWPATPVKRPDVCGAGDQVLAALGVMLAEGHSFIDAARIANTAAGIKCGKIGTTPCTREELDAQ